MHEPAITSIAHGGGPSRRDIQAASLFGLERYGDDLFNRIQGYAAGSISISDSGRTFTCWPRRLVQVSGSRMKLTPDLGQDIDELSCSFSLTYNLAHGHVQHGSTGVSIAQPDGSSIELSPSSFDLSGIRHPVGDLPAHYKVRRVEQETCIYSLKTARMVWLVADWGMGDDGFISSVRRHLPVVDSNIFRIDFGTFSTREAFFDDLRTRYGASFQQICESIADTGPSILIIDDVDVTLSGTYGTTIERDIELIARAVADFASNTSVLIRSRKTPRQASSRVIELRPLDEADVATYARESENGRERYGKPDAASILYRHTDGVPTRIDAALRDLEIVSLGDLISANPDFRDGGVTAVSAPPWLVATVKELADSTDRSEQRAHELLLALAALPQGEQLTRLTRFLGVHPFGPKHARTLVERSLIETLTLTPLNGMKDESTSKVLVVPRPVRDYIRDTIDEETARLTDLRALTLYFGDSWATGAISTAPTAKRVREALCDGYEIQNSNMLILRSMRRSLERGTPLDIENILRLALAFIEILVKGKHFRSASSLCEDLINQFNNIDGLEHEFATVRYEYARSLRMCGRIDEARATFESLDYELLTKQQRQQADLGLALCLESQGQSAAAAEVARRTIEIDKTSSAALQAKAVIAEQIVEDSVRTATLERLLNAAKRGNHYVLVGNIMLDLARGARLRGEESDMILRQVIHYARMNGDFYNLARAIVDLSSQNGAEHRITQDEQNLLIEAYHYLYSERLYSLFDRCHAALWKFFEINGDQTNLLNLFRHSSFIWRLSNREANEMTYLKKLTRIVNDLIERGLTQASRDGAYFIVRVTLVLGTENAEASSLET